MSIPIPIPIAISIGDSRAPSLNKVSGSMSSKSKSGSVSVSNRHGFRTRQALNVRFLGGTRTTEKSGDVRLSCSPRIQISGPQGFRSITRRAKPRKFSPRIFRMSESLNPRQTKPTVK